MNFIKFLTISLIVFISNIAIADEATIKKNLEDKLKVQVKSVKPAAINGLYEVFTGSDIIYTDEKATTVITGDMIDIKNMRNISQERMTTLTAFKFSQLNLNNAVKIVRGNGKRLMATFEDPRCGYCKKLAKDMTKLKDVTIYTFILPVLGEESVVMSKKIWCSRDRVAAWNGWMIEGKEIEGRSDCNTKVLNENIEFARNYAINGTPAIVFASGERFNGAVPLDKIEQALSKPSAE